MAGWMAGENCSGWHALLLLDWKQQPAGWCQQLSRLMQARTIPGTKVPCSAPPLFNSRSVGLDGLVLPNGWVDQSIQPS